MEPYCEFDPNADRETTPIETTERTYKDPYEDCKEDHGCEYMCKMIDNVPTCTCQSGYEIEDVTTCVDIDECYENNGGCQSTCVNKPGTFQCKRYYHLDESFLIINFFRMIAIIGECPMGYIVDDLHCIDENECVSNNGHGPCQDTCTNLEGSFTCGCEGLPGTVLAADGKSCEEIDICKENNGGCSHECLTSYGQSFCTCPTGMKLDVDWKTCVDQSGKSVLTTNVQKMSCESGFILDPLTNECVDDNECDKNPCGDNGYCVNEQPGYRCDCFKGYEFDAKTCVDTNECLDNSCANGICINTDGNYQCKCYEGYELDIYGMNCIDINECVEENICGSGTCVNLDGGFDCDCPKGVLLFY